MHKSLFQKHYSQQFQESPRTHVTALNLIESDTFTTRSTLEPRISSYTESILPYAQKIVPIHFRVFILGSNEFEMYHQSARRESAGERPFLPPVPIITSSLVPAGG